MWIIPRNLHTSPSVPDTEESTLDSQELSEQLEQSLMWRSKPSRSRTWSRRLKTNCSTWRLFSRISSASRGRSIVEKWISSRGASLVSHLAPQDDAQEMTTPATCSPTSSTVSESWENLPLFSWKTSKVSYHQSSTETGGTIRRGRRFCSMSSESWSAWVTTRRREYSLRVKSAPPISGNACSSWVVAPISATQGAILFQGCSETQSPEASTWLTPATTAGDAREPLFTANGEPWTGDGRAYRSNGIHRTLTLNMQVSTPHQEAQSPTHGSPRGLQWGTPNTLDHLAQRSEEALRRQATTGGRKRRQAPGNLREQVNPRAVAIYQAVVRENTSQTWGTPRVGCAPAGGGNPLSKEYNSRIENQVRHPPLHLNPRWVETLMGLPVGWTMPSCVTPWITEPTNLDYSETESSPQPLNARFASCGETSPDDNEP